MFSQPFGVEFNDSIMIFESSLRKTVPYLILELDDDWPIGFEIIIRLESAEAIYTTNT